MKNKWQYEEIGLIVVAGIIALILLIAPKVMGATEKIDAVFPEIVDSVYLTVYYDGSTTATDSTAGRADVQSFDTTVTLTDGKRSLVVLKYRWNSTDSVFSTWCWNYDYTADKVIDSLADVLDSMETQSTWIQDSLYALLDTLQLWDTRVDSIEAALADASIGDKIWTDATSRTVVAEDTLTTGDTVAVMPTHWVAADSTAYQGDASGLDSTAVYGAVEQLVADSVVATMPSTWSAADSGGFQGSASGLDSTTVYGAVVQAAQDSTAMYAGSGSGQYALTLVMFDTSASPNTTVSGVSVTIYDETGNTAKTGTQLTGADGIVTANLSDDSFMVVSTASWYTFPSDTIVVDSSETDTIRGYAYSPDAPGSADMVNVYGYIRDVGGNLRPYERISFSLPDRIMCTCDSTIPSSLIVTTMTDADGKFELDLLKSKCWIDGDDTLRYKMQFDGLSNTYEFIAPDSASFKLLWGD
ncbi:MAG: hypothetical protein U9N61_02675 [Euryarchaeota archaeon]|nr:hypothetical protein [Euryarchaeota archaeon]